jgi:hypothetical protein
MSVQALLMRASVLGRLDEVSYRNAMMTLSSRGWRRAEPGQMTVLEQPSIRWPAKRRRASRIAGRKPNQDH